MTVSATSTADEQEEIRLALSLLRRTVIENPYIPVMPTEPQAVFLTVPVREVMYGGAGGGGKSVAELMAALQYVDVPGYAALLLRRTYADLSLPGALIPLSHQWLQGTKAVWDGIKHEWRFPSGATLGFGYLDTENDKYRYQGAAFQLIAPDELTQFTESQYRYLFSRLRKPATMTNVPLRMRSATNPGGVGHEWVKRRFIDTYDPDRLFIPAKLEDNPYLDRESYEESLSQLDPVTRKQMRHGDWDVRPEGNLFRREWFRGKTVDFMPAATRIVRRWDLAATTEGENGNDDPDWTAGVKMARTLDNRFIVCDLVHLRGTPNQVQKTVYRAAERDDVHVQIRMEQEPGSSGKTVIDTYRREVLTGFDFRGVRSTGDKVTRSGSFSAACEAGDVYLLRGAWNEEFLDELCAFPAAGHDDIVDAAVGAHHDLTRGNRSWDETTFNKITQREEDMPESEYRKALMEAMGKS